MTSLSRFINVVSIIQDVSVFIKDGPRSVFSIIHGSLILKTSDWNLYWIKLTGKSQGSHDGAHSVKTGTSRVWCSKRRKLGKTLWWVCTCPLLVDEEKLGQPLTSILIITYLCHRPWMTNGCNMVRDMECRWETMGIHHPIWVKYQLLRLRPLHFTNRDSVFRLHHLLRKFRWVQ